jgi:hypothetical protein
MQNFLLHNENKNDHPNNSYRFWSARSGQDNVFAQACSIFLFVLARYAKATQIDSTNATAFNLLSRASLITTTFVRAKMRSNPSFNRAPDSAR